MDQGVIRSLKTHYRGRVVRLLCRDQAYPKISILQAMKILAASWEAVTRETIVNCFKKAGINTVAQHAAITDSDDPFKDLQESLDALKAADPDMVPEDISAESMVDIDNDVIATAPVITDDDILEQFQKDHSPEFDEEDGCDDESLNDEVPERPSRSEVESALGVLKNASLFSNTGEEMQCVIFKFENLFTKQRINSSKQSDIRVFLESTSSLYLLLCNAFNSYKKLIVHHITTYLFFSFSFPESYELLSISNFSLSRTRTLSISNKSLGPLRVRDRE